jgi:hypothetical protein
VYQDDTDILFPMRVAPALRDLRGTLWRELVDRACCSPDASEDQLAFSLLLIRLSGCISCHTDSFRAMRGCTACACQSVRRFRGDEGELVRQFERARAEVIGYLSPSPLLVPAPVAVSQAAQASG